MRRGEPLGAVAAALASPETAERIAVLEAATSGKMSALLAARHNVARSGGDLSTLDGLHARPQQTRLRASGQSEADTQEEAAEIATSSGPFALNGHHRSSQNGSR